MSGTESGTPNESEQGGNQTGETTPDAGGEFKAIESQEELNAVIKDRIARERAKFGDYEDLRAKAARLDEIEQANKTEAERLAEEAANARTEAEQARAELLRYRVAAEHGITDSEDIALFLTGTDEDTLKRQAERLAARQEAAGQPRAPRPDPNQGRQTRGPASTADQFSAAMSGLL